LASDLSVVDSQWRQRVRHSIVGPVEEYDVCESHANQEGDDSQQHDPIFREQLLSADISPDDTNKNNGNGIQCRPPASEKSGLDVSERLEVRGLINKSSKKIHCCWAWTSRGSSKMVKRKQEGSLRQIEGGILASVQYALE
jgi:hypothetical protein